MKRLAVEVLTLLVYLGIIALGSCIISIFNIESIVGGIIIVMIALAASLLLFKKLIKKC
jgi:hypothetical protein